MKDFNVSMGNKFIINFYKIDDLSSIINKLMCYKNVDKSTSIGSILTSKPCYFQYSNLFETGLSDFPLLTVTEFKMGFLKLKPQVITYRN